MACTNFTDVMSSTRMFSSFYKPPPIVAQLMTQLFCLFCRDLHPGNVLVTADHPIQEMGEYRYLLADFGAGHYSDHPINSIDKSIKTHSGFFIAPEVKAGERGSVEADVYSLGCIGRHLIRLRKQYYEGESTEDKTDRGPKALRQILDECIVRDPLKRPKPFSLTSELEKLFVPDLMKDKEIGTWEIWDNAWQLWNNEDEKVSTRMVNTEPLGSAASPTSLVLADLKEMLKGYEYENYNMSL